MELTIGTIIYPKRKKPIQHKKLKWEIISIKGNQIKLKSINTTKNYNMLTNKEIIKKNWLISESQTTIKNENSI